MQKQNHVVSVSQPPQTTRSCPVLQHMHESPSSTSTGSANSKFPAADHTIQPRWQFSAPHHLIPFLFFLAYTQSPSLPPSAVRIIRTVALHIAHGRTGCPVQAPAPAPHPHLLHYPCHSKRISYPGRSSNTTRAGYHTMFN